MMEQIIPFNANLLTELPSAWLIVSGSILFLIFQVNFIRSWLGAHAQPSISLLVKALKKPLVLAITGYLLILALSWFELKFAFFSNQEKFFATLDNLQAAINFIAIFWFIFRLIHFSQQELITWSKNKGYALVEMIIPVLAKVAQFITLLMLINTALTLVNIAPYHQLIIYKSIKLIIIAAIAWLAVQIVLITEKALLNRYHTAGSDDLAARKIYTEAHVLKKIALFVIGLITLASMLMTFNSVRELGQSLLASAGIASIIAGIAAQRSLGGIFAGLQLAISQPIRMGDTVVIEGEFGQVEEITLTYVVLKLWDLRRLILPIVYFIEKPFQNWTRQSSKLLAPVFFQVDYSVPIATLRKVYEEIVKSSPLWDGEVCKFQVSEVKEHTLEIRGLISAADSGKAWDLRCEIREKLIDYLQNNYPQALPKHRVEMAQSVH
jgi:small-conductance mechanosensitive channel